MLNQIDFKSLFLIGGEGDGSCAEFGTKHLGYIQNEMRLQIILNYLMVLE
jgi:hypothetical protein